MFLVNSLLGRTQQQQPPPQDSSPALPAAAAPPPPPPGPPPLPPPNLTQTQPSSAAASRSRPARAAAGPSQRTGPALERIDPRGRPRTKGAKVVFEDDLAEDNGGGERRTDAVVGGSVRRLKPRQYQLALLEQAKLHNIIACLDTGAGKTLVAVMLLQHFNDVELARTAEQQQRKKQLAQVALEVPLRRIGLFLVTRVALVDQQSKVVAENSNLVVARLSGAESHANSNRQTWLSARRHQDVVVATAEVVRDALTRGLLHMDDIYLIVFDEVHNAIKASPYASIMKLYGDHVARVGSSPDVSPRIFGMTASPVQRLRASGTKTSEQLEQTMHAYLLTAPAIHRAELALAVNKPVEYILEYDPPGRRSESALTASLRAKSRERPDLAPILDRIDYHTQNHGPLIADIVWAASVVELGRQATAQSAHTLLDRDWLLSAGAGAENDNARHQIVELVNGEVKRLLALPDKVRPGLRHVTPKVMALLDVLGCYAHSRSLRGIIFVQRRETAYALDELIKRHADLAWVRSAFVIGHGESSEFGALQQSHSQQEAVLLRFKSGEYNLLIATSVIEEGLDVSPCNLVVRFDLYDHHIAFVQSRGRARHRRSHFVALVERGNEDYWRLVREVEETDRALRAWLADLPEERIHDAVVGDAGREDPDAGLVLQVEKTGARVYVDWALQLFATCHSSLVSIHSKEQAAVYEVETVKEGYRCTLKLPPSWKIPDIVTDVRASKRAAKKLAAFRALEAMHKAGLINDYFETKQSQKRREQHRSYGMPATRLDDHLKVKTRQLQNFRGLRSGFDAEARTWNVHATLVRLDDLPHAALNGACRPMIVLTADPIERSGPCKMRFPSVDHITSGFGPSTPVQVDDETMELYKRYTLLLLRWVGQKYQWSCRDDDYPYMVVPASLTASKARVFDFAKAVDRDELRSLDDGKTKAVTESGLTVSIGGFWDRILLERPSEVAAVVYSVTGVTKYKDEYGQHEERRQAWRAQSSRSKSAWHGQQVPSVPEGAREEDWFTVSRVGRMQNWLTGQVDLQQEHKQYHAVALPPSMVWVHAVSASAYRSALVMPSVLERFDHTLGAMRCNAEIFEGKLAIPHLVEALTVPFAGYAFNYERLEFLGDTFLKLLATAYVFAEHIDGQEGHLHNARKDIIQNRALLKHCERLHLGDFMNLRSHSARGWVPANFVLSRVGTGASAATTVELPGERYKGYLPGPKWLVDTPAVSIKTLADLVESTLGAGLMSNGIEGALLASRCLGILPRPMGAFAEVSASYHSKTAQRTARIDAAVDKTKLKSLEGFLQYSFRSPHLALQATTHQSSLASTLLASYERLEFLGDAVLDYLAVMHIYNEYPDLDQGDLTELKDKLCQNRTLGALAEYTGWHEFLTSIPKSVLDDIHDANAALQSRRADEERKPAQQRGVYWADVKVPKHVADVVESLVGAVALDCGFDMKVLQGLYDRLFRPFYQSFCRPNTEVDDAVRDFEWLMGREGCRQWKYVHDYTYEADAKVYQTAILAHDVQWTTSGLCRSRRRAHVQACKNALMMFRKHYYLDDFRHKCNCAGAGVRRDVWGAGKRKAREVD